MNKDKTIRIIYFSLVIVLAIIICVLYSDKKMFENRYNSEFYNNFNEKGLFMRIVKGRLYSMRIRQMNTNRVWLILSN
jgi:prolipoprotein diacylglyceryltransferase